jgi:hypothetical protein
MSTRIYTGWCIATGDMQEVYRLIQQVRPKAERLANKMIDDFLAKGGDWNDWRTRQLHVKRTQERDPEVDTEFKLCVYPLPQVIYGSVLTEHEAFYQMWRKLPGVLDWSYWNSTDKDEDVTDEEWEERRAFWDTIRLPATDGFCIDVLDPNGPFPKAWRSKRHSQK